FPAPARAWIVPPGLLRRDRLLFVTRSAPTTHELKLGHFLLLLAVDVPGEVLHRALGSLTLIGRDRHHLGFVLFFLLLVFIGWEGQYRPLTVAIAAQFIGTSHLQEEQVPDGLVFDSIHHVLEQREGLLLVLDQRVFL